MFKYFLLHDICIPKLCFKAYALCSLCLKDIKRGVSYLRLRPDRVAMQDATAQVGNYKTGSLANKSTCCDMMLLNSRY